MKQYPIAIVEDRFGGQYSGGAWVAIAGADTPHDGFPSRAAFILEAMQNGEAFDAQHFWISLGQPEWMAVGDTPDEALKILRSRVMV